MRLRALLVLVLAIAIAAVVAVRWSAPAAIPVAEVAGAPPAQMLAPAPAAAPAIAPIVQDRLTRERFVALTREVLSGLPRAEEIRDIEDLHSSPEALDQAGVALGRVARVLAAQPELTNEAADFYKDCAATEGLLTSVRALCYGNLERLDAGTGKDVVPDSVRALAARLKGWS